jgi:predicted nucleic acid-binding protein
MAVDQNNHAVVWLKDVQDSELHLSAVTIGEIQAGIEFTRAQDPGKAQEREAWVDQLAGSYNVLAMDSICFRRCAKLMCSARACGGRCARCRYSP